jgi:hypothetical protein
VNATCQRPAASKVTRYDFTPLGTARDHRNRTQPAFGTHTTPTFAPLPADMLGPNRDDPESLMSPGFAPRRWLMGLIEELRHCLSEIPQCLLLHYGATRSQPSACRSPPTIREADVPIGLLVPLVLSDSIH